MTESTKSKQPTSDETSPETSTESGSQESRASKFVEAEFTYRQAFATNLVDYLSAKGITQIELAEGTGISKSAINAYCTGARYPGPSKLHTIARYLNIPETNLTGLAPGEPTPNDQEAYLVMRQYQMLDAHGQAVVKAVLALELGRVTGGSQ